MVQPEKVMQTEVCEGPSSEMSTVSSDTVHLKARHFVRTAIDAPVKPIEALQALILGNERFRSGQPIRAIAGDDMRKALVHHGQAPHTAIVGCADSRCPIETLFDALPGDLFVLRNAGNTCTHAEGSIVGSLEFCIGKLGTQLILVLGHTNCGAIMGATKTFLSSRLGTNDRTDSKSSLMGLLEGLCTVIHKASEELGPNASEQELAMHATKLNVFHTVDFLLKFSKSLRDRVKSGQIEIQGALYHLESGFVEFLGKSPAEDSLLSSADAILPPSMQ